MQANSHIPRSIFSPSLAHLDPTSRILFEADDGKSIPNTQPQNDLPKKESVAKSVEDIVRSVLESQRANGNKDEALSVLAGQVKSLQSALATEKERTTTVAPDVQAKVEFVDKLGGIDKAKAALDAGAAALTEVSVARLEDAVRADGFDPKRFKALAIAQEYQGEKKIERVTTKGADGKEIVSEVEVGYLLRTVDGKVESKRVADVVKERAADLADSLRVVPAAPVKRGAPVPKFGTQGVEGEESWDKIRAAKAAKQEAATKTAPVSWTDQLGLSSG